MSPPEVISELAISESEWRATRAVIELGAVAAGSVSGALHAIRREFDVIGVTVIALSAGLGGGIVRDLLLAQGPVLALRHPGLLLTALLAAFAGMLFANQTPYLRVGLWFADALSLGLFTVAGIQRAEEVGLLIIPALFLGVVTGTGGGLLRDVLSRETPALLVPGRPYAAAALLGALVYYGVNRLLGWPVVISEWLGILASFTLRAVGSWRGWTVPRPHEVRQRFRKQRPGSASKPPGEPPA